MVCEGSAGATRRVTLTSRPCVTLGACQVCVECVVRALCWLSSRQDRLGTGAVLEAGASRPHDRPRVLSHLPESIRQRTHCMAEQFSKSLSMAGKRSAGTTEAAFLQTCDDVHRPPALKQRLAANAVDVSQLIIRPSKGHLKKLGAGALGPPQPRLAHERPDGLLCVGRVDRDVVAKLLCACLPPARPLAASVRSL